MFACLVNVTIDDCSNLGYAYFTFWREIKIRGKDIFKKNTILMMIHVVDELLTANKRVHLCDFHKFL